MLWTVSRARVGLRGGETSSRLYIQGLEVKGTSGVIRGGRETGRGSGQEPHLGIRSKITSSCWLLPERDDDRSRRDEVTVVSARPIFAKPSPLDLGCLNQKRRPLTFLASPSVELFHPVRAE